MSPDHDLLRRNIAPLTPEAWKFVDEAATQVLKERLDGRRLVDFNGPHGWQYASVNTGVLKPLPAQPLEDVLVGIRDVVPLLEIRAPVRIPITEFDSIDRGCVNPDLSSIAQVAERAARIENRAVFEGFASEGFVGIRPASPHDAVQVADTADWPKAILEAKSCLQGVGISGPYALALGSSDYEEVFAATVGGYPIAAHLQKHLIKGPIVQVPELDEALLLSMRGGDYELVVGQDWSIGYTTHDRDFVELYISESFAFRVLEPAAAVRFVRAS